MTVSLTERSVLTITSSVELSAALESCETVTRNVRETTGDAAD